VYYIDKEFPYIAMNYSNPYNGQNKQEL
jgi:hypothetical protein